jgi:hypothetical protein
MTAVRRCIASTALAAGQSSSAVKALLALATASLALAFSPAQAQPKAKQAHPCKAARTRALCLDQQDLHPRL